VAKGDVVGEFFKLQGKIDRISGKIVAMIDFLTEVASDDSKTVEFARGVDVDEVISFYRVLIRDCEKIIRRLNEIKAAYALG